jgi:hypothetical protein
MQSLMQMNNIIKDESSYPFFPNLKTGLNMYVPVGMNSDDRLPATCNRLNIKKRPEQVVAYNCLPEIIP